MEYHETPEYRENYQKWCNENSKDTLSILRHELEVLAIAIEKQEFLVGYYENQQIKVMLGVVKSMKKQQAWNAKTYRELVKNPN